MEGEVRFDIVYAQSENVVSRDIEGELLIVPLISGIGDMEDELFTMNETGKAIWERLDGQKKLQEIMLELSAEFDVSVEELEKDVVGFVAELIRRGMLVEKSAV